MTEEKKPVKEKVTSKKEKAEIAVTKKKSTAITKHSRKPAALAPSSSSDIWQAFDDTFARFRNDFEDLLFPANWAKAFSFIPEVRVPVVDLKDDGKEFHRLTIILGV